MSSTQPSFPSSFPKTPAQTAEQLRAWGLATQVLLGAQGAGLLALALLTLVGAFGPVVFVADLWMLQEALRSLVGGLCLLACAAGVVAWLRWQHLCARLLDAGLGRVADRALRRSPSWHVGSWFVPGVCLWWPPQNIGDLDREAWRRAHDPAQPVRPAAAGDPGSGLRTTWWATWLAGGALCWPIFSASYYSAVLLVVLSCAVAAISAACGVLLVRRIGDGLTGAPQPGVNELLARWFPRTAHTPSVS